MTSIEAFLDMNRTLLWRLDPEWRDREISRRFADRARRARAEAEADERAHAAAGAP